MVERDLPKVDVASSNLVTRSNLSLSVPIFRYAVRDLLPPIDFGVCVSGGQVFRWRKSESNAWRGVDGCHAFSVQQTEVGDLVVESTAPQEIFENFLRLDLNLLDAQQKILAAGPELQPYLNVLSGLRMLRPSDPAEVLFSFLCTSNNHLIRIQKMVDSLSSMGERFNSPFDDLHRFPNLETIANVTEQDLRELGFGYRAKTIPQVAQVILSRGDGWLDWLAEQPYEVIVIELQTLPGVGPKLADCVALFAFDQGLAVPIDTHVWQVACKLYFPDWQGKAVTGSRYREIGNRIREQYGELAGIAHQYMFLGNRGDKG